MSKLLTALTELTAVEKADQLVISDDPTGATELKRAGLENFFLVVNDFTNLAVPAGADVIYVIDDVAGTPVARKATITNLAATIEGLLSSASDTVSGLVELATIAETNTGTDATRAVTPDGLDGWTGSAQITTVGTLSAGDADAAVTDASLTAKGKVELATGAETNTGTDATRAVTPDGLDDWTGSAQITTVGTLTSGNATAIVDTASPTTPGISELATAAEISTGTDAGRTITPDALAGSDMGYRSVILQPIADTTDHAAGDGKQYFPTPEWLAGWNLVDIRVHVVTAGTVSGLFSIMIHNLTQTADMCSTVFSVDPTELTSDTAATPGVIDGAQDDITAGDVLRIDFDAVHGTVGKGCYVELVFQLP